MLGSVSRPDPLLTPDALGPKASRFCARGDPCAWGRENLADTEPCQQTLQKINTLQNQGPGETHTQRGHHKEMAGKGPATADLHVCPAVHACWAIKQLC
ncbi:hypothetical protein Y1Q_0008135 [Alligator mississippiensis]|uniref:Uncharacterized protein n=1 Tax=Alligator mississippiensis TaxID=8496 RepID=A0A151N6A8_ALLMI|nr:hypothetical protein Y1Q_0008135 [Alligator mississippiensis]